MTTTPHYARAQPTDADRQRARDLLAPFVFLDAPHCIGPVSEVAAVVASAIAAARAEGFEAGLREPERRARQLLGDQARGIFASNLKEPGHE